MILKRIISFLKILLKQLLIMQTEYKNCSYKALRKFNHEYQTQDVLNLYSIDINSFSKNPYTYLKSRYFLELSTIIVYFRENLIYHLILLVFALHFPASLVGY